MLYLTGANLKEGVLAEYVAWMKKNKKQIKEHAPPGWTYRGTYMSVLGFGRYHVYEMWELKKYGDFDVARNWKDKVSDRLAAEGASFFIQNEGEAMLLRDFDDVVFIEPKKPKK